MIDCNGYRSNVGIILLNKKNEVFWGKRIKQDFWQFPQGGIEPSESPEQAMYRELTEETGLCSSHVTIIGRTRNWLRYEVPDQWIKRDWRKITKGRNKFGICCVSWGAIATYLYALILIRSLMPGAGAITG